MPFLLYLSHPPDSELCGMETSCLMMMMMKITTTTMANTTMTKTTMTKTKTTTNMTKNMTLERLGGIQYA